MDFQHITENVRAISYQFDQQCGERQDCRYLESDGFGRLADSGFLLVSNPVEHGRLCQQDVRALDFIRPLWGLAFDAIYNDAVSRAVPQDVVAATAAD